MSQAERLLSFGQEMNLFTAPDGGCYVTFGVKDRLQTHAVNSQNFESYLVEAFYRAEGIAPQPHAVRQALSTYMARARFSGVVHPVHVRVAGHGGRVYIDLADDEWRVIEVDADGWRLVSDAPVRFRRPGGMLALPMPERGGKIDDLRPFINVQHEGDFKLVVAFLLGSLRPQGPFAHLELLGEQGSAKSTTARVIRSLVDPNFSPLRAEPGGERDLAIAASNTWMPAWDNLSYLPPWMSDALCRLSTGGGFSTRALYTDADEKTFQLTRPAILTGIGDVAVRGDLLDRTVILRLPCLTGNRVAEVDFWRRFEAVRPRILGVLLDAVSAAIRNVETVKVPRLPRLADFGQWVSAGESAFGWAPGTTLDAFFANQEEANCVVLEGSAVAPIVIDLAHGGDGWSGTATDLLSVLNRRAEFTRAMPRTPAGLRSALNRLIPNLRRAGVEVEFARVGKASTRTIFIRKSAESVGGVGAVGREVA